MHLIHFKHKKIRVQTNTDFLFFNTFRLLLRLRLLRLPDERGVRAKLAVMIAYGKLWVMILAKLVVMSGVAAFEFSLVIVIIDAFLVDLAV